MALLKYRRVGIVSQFPITPRYDIYIYISLIRYNGIAWENNMHGIYIEIAWENNIYTVSEFTMFGPVFKFRRTGLAISFPTHQDVIKKFWWLYMMELK